MALHTGRLLLTPKDLKAVPPREPLRAALTQAGLLGARLTAAPGAGASESDASRFAPGERFFDYVGFTGCAVKLDGLPGTAGPAGCHLRLDPPSTEPRFWRGRNTRPPRCPACGKTVSDWRPAMEDWSWPERTELACPACGTRSLAWQWDWRGHAGFGRLTLTIEEVFPGEAAVLPALPRLLERFSDGLPWHWFALQD
ncbi:MULTISPECIES: FmdB family zinc ribbon protein [Thiorhodovibrio]|uniref:hypothetical protein n=1 Tax=Thiorhodovibrio TaxID=61593 RepID=UPI0019113918|nr:MULTISPECIES: hypothetical protein [Thiorhodovibrio]MBK5968981.1 hypothetical protein [Thiorhodovibrio winogradskyi]WPL10303.1 hypothetical protein Thiosp_00015 [Thiorhodovibrio litoralis]